MNQAASPYSEHGIDASCTIPSTNTPFALSLSKGART